MQKKTVHVILLHILFCSKISGCMDESGKTRLATDNPQTVIRISNDDMPSVKNDAKKNPPIIPPVRIIQPQPPSSSRTLMKTRVTSINELKNQIKEVQMTHRTARGAPPVQKHKRIIVDANDAPTAQVQQTDDLKKRKKTSTLPTALVTNLINKPVDIQKTYTEKEVWDLIQSCNPILHDFGKKHKLDLEDLAVFAACVEKHAVEPQVIIEHLNPNQNQQQTNGLLQRVINYVLGDPHQQSLDYMHAKYAEMEKKEPENYKALLLELFKTIADEEEGGEQTQRSKIADTHTALQNDQIATQIATIRQQYIGIGAAGLTSIVGWVLTILQFINPSVIHSNCTS